MHRGQDLFRTSVGMRATAAVVFLFLCGFIVLRRVEGSEAWLKTVKLAELGTEILLPCVLKSPQCDGLHSIKWYHGSTRIFIFSEDAGVIRGNNDIAARADIEYSSNSSRSYLKLSEIQLNNEGLYKCEATYMAVNRECNNVQHVLLNVTVQPAFVRVIDENSKNTLSTGATLGPINEGSTISLYCESGEGKPVPTVEWFKDDELLEATNSRTVTDTGIGTGSSLLEMQITREELGATFTCKVNNIALVEPLTVDINLDIHVRPLKMDLEGVVGHVVQGTKILLQCKVQAARPAANVTWKNGTHLLSESNERFEMFETKIHENEDSTFETISYLAFTASVYDNGKTFKCYAENSVTRTEDLKPMKEATTIEVLYPPIIKMKPNNITVNETDDFLIFCDYEANPATLLKVTWIRDDDELVLNEEHYDGGITEQTALTVKNATPSDMGSYKCILENNAGPTVSEATVQVSVFYKPVVEVIMDPETPVNEADRQNVSLTCEVDAGNPAILTAVRWYLDGDLLKELPDCSRNSTAMTTSSEESLAFCDIDPSKLLLESVGRTFHGNYSCEGKNDAGWGPNSPSTSVIVYYKPGPASITYEPRQVVKKQALSITCFVLDPGRPRVLGFKWLRGWHRLPDENEATLFIESVNLETEANFTCLAYNEAGDGEPATTFIDVSVAPTFIKKLHSYRGYVYNAPNVSIMCWIECAPICTISWLRDDIPMNFTKTNRYYVSNVYHPPDPRTDDFESIQSTLIWNLTVWPNGQLDRAEDNVKFTCKSSSNGIGPGVESFTHFHVEFPPEDITISKKIINVIVDTVPETVECNAKARPKPNFRWFREGSTDIIMEGHVFDLKMPIPRRSSGTYYCEAWNRHGSLNISFIMNVQFKPECHIEKERFEGQDYVVCSAIANPKETDFTWSLKNENDSLEQVAQIRNGKSYMLLDTSVTNFRTYVCVANNTIGHSVACERDIPAHHGVKRHIPWWYRLDGNLLLIIIVMTVVMILVLILICVAIYIVCRRKRSQLKYPNQAANNNHVNSVSEVLPDSGTKTFYENLPFHGIQAPPNKLVTPKFARVSALHGTLHSITTSPCSSRPPSRAVSLCDGSSGYESTMSHLGPHYNIYNVPRSNSPVLKYNTLKPRRRKQKHSQQFYSLRLCRRHENIRRKYELYAIPIYKTCPHRSDSTATIATIVRSMEDTPSLTLSQSSASISLVSRSAPSTPIPPSPTTPPVPAPRMSKKTDPSKHTYQNVPPPVFPPKNASLPKLKTDSLYNYKEHYQQQHRQEMQQYSYPLPSNSSNQLTLPLTSSLYHSSIVSPLQTSLIYTNNSRPSTLMHHEAATTGNHSAVHQDEEQQQPNYGNSDARQSSTRRHATNRRNERNRKYRKHERMSSDRNKSKQSRQRDAPSRRNNTSFVDTPNYETSFRQIPDLGVPETTYKISYPHYYEDDIAECSTDYHRPNPTKARQQQPPWEHQSDRCTGNNTPQFTADAGDAKNRNKTSKTRLSDTRSIPSAPTIMQYAEFHFRDVGQEIDV
ncbi:PREDICTED: hemicentin-1 isoform X1 [Trachymyrmex septentrionalis]|uniref:hemicentin-1 isoform X1 n=1 Tax=Trachymyrmex septentrionalis TaxID=34720 RepID=UPI00084F086E|nr:PREDICTED: hemicentin-1 isoform X1 [Trachymyrmex septentrionalis]XP_018356528.1 PREDICTED: hemicentin-1 isoform X1 [Trachymyrmex septentrionalis]